MTNTTMWTAESIHDHLLEQMLDRRIGIDDVLVETTLSAQFSVSRTPVREALGRIVDAGLLRRTPRGYRLPRWSQAEVLDLYQARIALESEAAGLAAERHHPLDLARLEHWIEQAAATSDTSAVLKSNGQWHATIRSACHNAALTTLLDRVSLQLRVAEANDTAAQDAELNDREHRAIIAALRSRDSDLARELMRAHLTRVRNLRTQQFARSE